MDFTDIYRYINFIHIYLYVGQGTVCSAVHIVWCGIKSTKCFMIYHNIRSYYEN